MPAPSLVGSTPLRVGIFGLGVVGGGVVQLLQSHPKITLVKAYVRDSTKKRCLPNSVSLVTSVDDILLDPKIDCVVEVMGGTTLAWDVVREAIMNGKHVVTANKALISKYLDDLEELLKEHPTVQFFYEAAVCGGIPIIATMRRSLAPDAVKRVVGILNGTTNYMLSNMEATGKSYATALKEAQIEGYAEADPSADVLGWDARSKLCILAKLAFGKTLDETQVHCTGISRIEATDFEYANMLKRTIKLLGIAEIVSDSVDDEHKKAEVAAAVCPVMVPLANPLAHVSGATNAVAIDSDNLGSSLLVGPGAGRFPTANSVVADMMDLHEILTRSLGKPAHPAFGTSRLQDLRLATDYQAEFYIRIIVHDRIGVIAQVSDILARYHIPIFSIMQTPIIDPHRVPFAVITEKCKLSSVQGMCDEIQRRRQSDLEYILEEPFCLRYFGDAT